MLFFLWKYSVFLRYFNYYFIIQQTIAVNVYLKKRLKWTKSADLNVPKSACRVGELPWRKK